MSDWTVLDKLKTLLRTELDNGPDATNPLPNACPRCADDVWWQRIIEWRTYPDGREYQLECVSSGVCGFEEEVTL